jgi:LAS superfamily LD-carboxypeptidase LdcB
LPLSDRRGAPKVQDVGIEGVNARIADIQSRIIALQTQQKTAQSTTSTTSAGGAATASGAAFAGYLSDAVSTTSAADKTYTLNAQGIPTDLAAYGNGHIPASALEPVGNTSHKLWAPAAENLTRMIQDAKKDGVTIGINETYRPYSEQVDLAKRKGLYSQGGLAAKPGTSEHGWGMATDLELNSSAQSWMKQHASDYGFVNNVPRESWHWAYKPKPA